MWAGLVGAWRVCVANFFPKMAANVMALASSEVAGKPKALPEVPLKWSDFVSSLEKLRYRPYNKKTVER